MEIPGKWKEILSKVQTISPDAIIAGGALRDLDNGKPIKDLDIFVPLTADFSLGSFYNIFGVREIDESSNAEEYQNNEEVCGVYVYNLPDFDIPLNLIVCKPNDNFTMHQLERFDIGICKIAYDGTSVVQHHHYVSDKSTKKLVIYNTVWMVSSINRLQRLGLKYPDWAQINQAEIDALMKSVRGF